MMGGTREPAKDPTRTIIKEESVDPKASLPEGTLNGPFLDRQRSENKKQEAGPDPKVAKP
jgi:hypothetical protein